VASGVEVALRTPKFGLLWSLDITASHHRHREATR
jgi:hypothetical protein